jgi:uroporphyrinogen decarboxylase
LDSREIVKRSIEFERPSRLPFMQHEFDDLPDDIFDCQEMDHARSGWFFGKAGADDWGCGWALTDQKNMGQVVYHPLEDWSGLSTYSPPRPRDPFYFEGIEKALPEAGDRYVLVTAHFNLIERLHMLHGFRQTFEDFYLEPEKIEKLLDMILEFRLEQFDELQRRFGERIDGLFLTDDWGTQQGTLISARTFEHFFLERYRHLVRAAHAHGWHFMLHSCGRINDFVPYFIDVGVDVLNMQQPKAYGIKEVGERFAGSVCFLTTVDIQKTLPTGSHENVRAEARELVENWSTQRGGLMVHTYVDPESLGFKPEMNRVMLDAFAELMNYWNE